jgi:hypothetical protein
MINVTDVQGTKLYLVAAGTSVTDAAAIATAITGGVQIGCLQSIGTISVTKNVNEYTCISENSSAKSVGSSSLGNFSLSTLFNAGDSAGQADLRSMWNDGSRRILIIELNDNGGTNPTYITFETFPSSQDIGIEKDNAVMYDMTMEIASTPAITLAA